MTKAWKDDDWNDFEYWTKQEKTPKRILQLLKDIERNSYDVIGKRDNC